MCRANRTVTALLLAVGLLMASGCREERVRIHGKITLDGVAIETGLITFIPEDKSKGQTAGATVSQGEYQVIGTNPPPPGSYRIEIESQKKTGKQIPAGSPLPPGTMVDETVQLIPAKYNTKSELKRDLKSGDNPLDFELSSK
jgi:hypothetical protein